MSSSSAMPGSSSSELELPASRALAGLFIVPAYLAAMVIVAGFDYPASLIPVLLITILALDLARQLSGLRGRRQWRLLVADDGEIRLNDEGGGRAVACSFPYVTSWLVVVRVCDAGKGGRFWLPFLSAGLSREQWRRLHRLIRDGEQ